jgi:hypothetical protein
MPASWGGAASKWLSDAHRYDTLRTIRLKLGVRCAKVVSAGVGDYSDESRYSLLLSYGFIMCTVILKL